MDIGMIGLGQDGREHGDALDPWRAPGGGLRSQ